MDQQNTSHDYDNACDYLRTIAWITEDDLSLSKSQAARLIGAVAHAIDMGEKELIHKLASHWATLG